MFDLFKKSPKGVKVIDKVWLSNQAKWNACVQMIQVDPSILLVAWFEETFNEIEGNPGLAQNVVKAENLGYNETIGRMIVFAEHYPLSPVEQNVFAKLQLKEVPVLSSLEEPLFMLFGGGQNTIDVIRKLASGEDEIIGHSFVTKAIRNAQEKIGERSGTDYPAKSSKEWFTLNLNEKK